MISTEEKINGKNRLHFYFKNRDSVAELKFDPESPESFYSVSAVSFRDVSGDGKKDIIVIADYLTGFGNMGAIPISQLIIFKLTDSGFIEDRSIEDKARSGVPFRILTIQDVMTGLKTDPKESIPNAWQRLHLGTYKLEDSFAEMIFTDGKYELSIYMISNTDLFLRDNGQPYFGHNVYVNGTYTPVSKP